jgi:hydroxymethylpyrimidine pyrophosphatase-like HAD family hydrolase
MLGRGMVVTDLDGTLFQRDRRVSPRNLQVLEELGRDGVLRVIATGRNLYSARKVLADSFPVDYLLFSSGAGIMEWPIQRLLRAVSMSREQVERALELLAGRELDFMLHQPIPENHRFSYFRHSGRENPDFEARLAVYAEFAVPADMARPPEGPACQFVVVEPPDAEPSAYYDLRARLPGHTVIRSTSPLDGRSRWIEIFSPQVSKSQAAAWLAGERKIVRDRVLAVGNDYNDLDLLEWAPKACLVDGSPPELGEHFAVISGNGDADFAAAVDAWRHDTL